MPHYILNFEAQFRETVIANFVAEYAAGRTPIPCTHCNSDVKFSTLLDRARGFGASHVATGHYARVTDDGGGRRQLRRGADVEKDQSYFLFGLTQEQLTGALFPVGELSKAAVRAEAQRIGLAVAEKPDSQEICFVPDGDHAAFVARQRAGLGEGGAIVDERGETLGSHGGIHRFTVGQRKGLGVSAPAPLYVLRIDAAEGRVTVGPRQALERTRFSAAQVNWIAGTPPTGDRGAAAQIRHRNRPAPGRVRAAEGGRAEFEFDEPQVAVSPGQAAVFYDGDVVLGGGWIE
jgi:tRNA-specific 2-thiouridylase